MSEDWKKLFEAKQTDWLEVCKEVDSLRQENAELQEQLKEEQQEADVWRTTSEALEAQLATAREALDRLANWIALPGDHPRRYQMAFTQMANFAAKVLSQYPIPRSSRIEGKP